MPPWEFDQPTHERKPQPQSPPYGGRMNFSLDEDIENGGKKRLFHSRAIITDRHDSFVPSRSGVRVSVTAVRRAFSSVG